jgi:hypothetical protein
MRGCYIMALARACVNSVSVPTRFAFAATVSAPKVALAELAAGAG